MDLTVGDGALTHRGQRVDDAAVLGFHERFDPWRARVYLEVAGPQWSEPVDEDYGPLRRALRARFRDRPFTSDWSMDGHFAGLVLGGPPAPWTVLSTGGVVALVAATAWVLGPAAGLLCAVGWLWALSRLRAALVVGRYGVRAGPVWAPEVPWHEVLAVRYVRAGRAVQVRVITVHGVTALTLPAALWPACTARLRRLGGLVAEARRVDLDERYLASRRAAVALPWGVLAGVLVAGVWATSPWVVWTWGGLVAAALAFVGSAVEARLQGWRNGGIFWMTAAYGVVLFAVALAWLA